MKIKFLSDFRPAGQADDRPSYKKGETHEFTGTVAEGYAQKYVQRGLAEEVGGDAPVAQPDPVQESFAEQSEQFEETTEE